MKRLLLLLLIAIAAAVGWGIYKNSVPPKDLYTQTQRFAGCESWPSCVSSVATEDLHKVPALGYSGDANFAFSLLREVVQRAGGEIVDEQPGYLHAVFTAPRTGLKDDLELLVRPDGRIEVRALSRVPYRDGGANRARVEAIRRAFEAQP